MTEITFIRFYHSKPLFKSFNKKIRYKSFKKMLNCFLCHISDFLIKHQYAKVVNKAKNEVEINFTGQMLTSLLSTIFCLAVYLSSALIFRLFSTTYK